MRIETFVAECSRCGTCIQGTVAINWISGADGEMVEVEKACMGAKR